MPQHSFLPAKGLNSAALYTHCAGLLGDGFPYLLDLARRRVVQPGATVVPAAATLYCMGVEVLTGEVAGFNMAPMDAYRWAGWFELDLDSLRAWRLAPPAGVLQLAGCMPTADWWCHNTPARLSL